MARKTMHKYTTGELVAQKPDGAEFKKLPKNPVYFILHNIRSLENVGLFFRLADALRVEKIFLTGYTGYPDPQTSSRPFVDDREPRIARHAQAEIDKTAIKLVPTVPWEQDADVSKVLDRLKNLGAQVVGVEQTDVSRDYRTADYHFPVALLFGHEREGVEEELLAKCDLVVQIPMLGLGNSHNVAMSGAIISNFLVNEAGLKS